VVSCQERPMSVDCVHALIMRRRRVIICNDLRG